MDVGPAKTIFLSLMFSWATNYSDHDFSNRSALRDVGKIVMAVLVRDHLSKIVIKIWEGVDLSKIVIKIW